jgi:hypothetical protein
MDDICIFNNLNEEYAKYVREVLTRLRKIGLYVKLFKYEFDKEEIAFLKYVIDVYNCYKPGRTQAVSHWSLVWMRKGSRLHGRTTVGGRSHVIRWPPVAMGGFLRVTTRGH